MLRGSGKGTLLWRWPPNYEADIGDYFETHDINGKTIERPKQISELPRELQQNIEKIAVLPNGRAVPQLYSKLAASQELRKMLNFGRTDDAGVARMSDQELVAQLADLSQQLGVHINVNYSFVQQPSDKEKDGSE